MFESSRVLIAGGGVAAVEALLALRAIAGERLEVEVLAQSTRMEYRPLAVAEPFGQGRSRSYDLAAIAADQGANLRRGGLAEVRPWEHELVTREGTTIGYDVLLIAVGAKAGIGLPGAITVKGPRYAGRLRALLEELRDGRIKRLAFAVPPGTSWVLPLYELALLTAQLVERERLGPVELHLVTSEEEPLELFGSRASDSVRELLQRRGIRLRTAAYAVAAGEGSLKLVPGRDSLAVDRVISLPRLTGPRIPGLPADDLGFIPVDLHGRVGDLESVYAAGDATTFPVKQGGLATQQADAAAEAIAARAGIAIEPKPFRPVLRGMLLTGETPHYMRAEISGGRGDSSELANAALWWPPSKIAGRYLSPYLGLHHRELEESGEGNLPVEVELEARPAQGVRRRAIIG